MQQLIYTSAPQGLRPGTRGFTTVAATKGMLPPLIERLETLSGYQRPVNAAATGDADSPVSYACQRIRLGDRSFTVLSRKSTAGNDYSGRSNTIAHHLVFTPDELPPAGPAWILAQPNLFVDSWTGQPSYLPDADPLPKVDPPTQPCNLWQQYTGDAGWAGVLSEALNRGDAQSVLLIYGPRMNILGLMCEAIAVLPADRRWATSFDTYFTTAVAGVPCACRCVPSDSPLSRQARGNAGTLVIDLTKPLPAPLPSPWVNAARTGAILMPKASPQPPLRTNKPLPVTPIATENTPPDTSSTRDHVLHDMSAKSGRINEHADTAKRSPPKLAPRQNGLPRRARFAIHGFASILILSIGVILGMWAPWQKESEQAPTTITEPEQMPIASVAPSAGTASTPRPDDPGSDDGSGTGSGISSGSANGSGTGDGSGAGSGIGSGSANGSGTGDGSGAGSGDEQPSGAPESDGFLVLELMSFDEFPMNTVNFRPEEMKDTPIKIDEVTGKAFVVRQNLADTEDLSFRFDELLLSQTKAAVTVSRTYLDNLSGKAAKQALQITISKTGSTLQIEHDLESDYGKGILSVGIYIPDNNECIVLYTPGPAPKPRTLSGVSGKPKSATLSSVPFFVETQVRDQIDPADPNKGFEPEPRTIGAIFVDNIAKLSVGSTTFAFENTDSKGGVTVTVEGESIATTKTIELLFRDQFRVPIGQLVLKYTR